jgi:hypothetical protein
MAADRVEETLEAQTVVDVLTGMDLVADIHAYLVIGVEDRLPAAAELGEGSLDQPRRALRPGIDERPGERAGEGDVRVQPEAARGARGELHLLDGPIGTRCRVAAHFRRSEAVEGIVEGRMHGDELALKMRRKLGDRQTMAGGDALYLVAIGIGIGSLGEIEQPAVPARHLHALIAERPGPGADRLEGVEGRCIPRELGEENPGAFHGLHGKRSLMKVENWPGGPTNTPRIPA